MSCEICNRIELIKQKKEKYFIKEYTTGYLSLFDNQAYEGYCLFIYKQHIEEMWQIQDWYFTELQDIAFKIRNLYNPLRMNYAILGNGCSHLHTHIIPNNIPNKTIWHDNYRENFDYDVSEIIEKIRDVL